LANNEKYWVPELLCPAGSLEKLKVAIDYGADAVYLAGQSFGLRAAADNFTYSQLAQGVGYAHKRGSKVYVVINSFPFDKDILKLEEFVTYLEKISVDALIVSDIGAFQLIKKVSHIPVHVSTQASVLNTYGAQLWKKLGAERVILGREVKVQEAKEIKENTGLEIEQFVHGSMCMAYSGHCTISNFTQGRDSNRGGCSHSCRFKYQLETPLKTKDDFFMSSRDLEGVDAIEQFISSKIDSLKVEGRMKGPIYVATVARAYRGLLDFYAEHGFLSEKVKLKAKNELKKVSHREYFGGNLLTRADENSVFDEREHVENAYQVLGSIVEVTSESVILRTKSKINKGMTVQIIPFKGEIIDYQFDTIRSLDMSELEHTRPDQLLKLPLLRGVDCANIVRFAR